METENVEIKEDVSSRSDDLRRRADDLGFYGWGGILTAIGCTGAGVFAILNNAPWWPAAAMIGSLALFVGLALFLFSHLAYIRAEIIDRKG